jgi:hypothetical protein
MLQKDVEPASSIQEGRAHWILFQSEAVLNHKPLPPGVKVRAQRLAAEKAAILEKAVTQVRE